MSFRVFCVPSEFANAFSNKNRTRLQHPIQQFSLLLLQTKNEKCHETHVLFTLHAVFPDARICTDRRLYQRTGTCHLARQDWTLQDSTKTLLGYPCQLATCSYHGRDHQAWFTSDIPIANGPWKFKGLPGLILEVYDTQCHYQFQIEGIERTNIAPVCFYYTTPDPRNAERIDRIRYLQLATEGNAGIPTFLRETSLGSKKTEDGQRQHIAHDYLERDYHKNVYTSSSTGQHK